MDYDHQNRMIKSSLEKARNSGGNLAIFNPILALLSCLCAPSLAAQGHLYNCKLLAREASALIEQGRYAEAEPPLLQASSLCPKDTAILVSLAKAQARIGKLPEAIQDFRRVLALRPGSAEAHVDLAIALADTKELDTALSEVTRATRLEPQHFGAHYNRARILADLKRYNEANDEFKIAERLRPADTETLYYHALLERELGQIQMESALWQRFVAVNPKDARVFFMLGRSQLEQGDSAGAIAALRQALVLDPRNGDAMYMLSRALRSTAPEESKKLLQQFHAVRSSEGTLDQVKTLGNEAVLASQNQRWDEAVRLNRQAIALCHACEAEASLHRNLGLALCHAGSLAEGEAELRRALALNPVDADAVRALSIIGPLIKPKASPAAQH